ncbi:hypothetical protein [Chroococcidiopsis sp.]
MTRDRSESVCLPQAKLVASLWTTLELYMVLFPVLSALDSADRI